MYNFISFLLYSTTLKGFSRAPAEINVIEKKYNETTKDSKDKKNRLNIPTHLIRFYLSSNTSKGLV